MRQEQKKGIQEKTYKNNMYNQQQMEQCSYNSKKRTVFHVHCLQPNKRNDRNATKKRNTCKEQEKKQISHQNKKEKLNRLQH